MHHPRRRNVTTSMVGFKNGHIRKNLTQNGEPQRYSWGTQKKKKNPTKNKTKQPPPKKTKNPQKTPNKNNNKKHSMHHPRRRNVTTSMVGFKNGHIRKNLTQNGEPQRYSWGTQKKTKKQKNNPPPLQTKTKPKKTKQNQQQKTQHAPSTKTECDYLNGWVQKRSHTQKSHPKWRTPEI